MFKGGGGLGGMMKQAQKMQEDMQKAQAEIATMEVTGESGGGLVSVTTMVLTNVSVSISTIVCLVMIKKCWKT